MELTGHCSDTSTRLCRVQICALIWAMPSPSTANTSGQYCSHKPQPTHKSASTLTFIHSSEFSIYYIWEIPAGKLDHHEDPLDCAKRELIEEAGLKAKKSEKLITIYPSPGFSDEIMHIFVARDLTEVESKREKYEILTVHRLSTDTILKMIRKGEITDSKTLAALGGSFLGIN